MEDRWLLGITYDNELVFVQAEVNESENVKEDDLILGYSLMVVSPNRIDQDFRANISYVLDYKSATEKLELCDEYDCAPSALADKIIENADELTLAEICGNSYYDAIVGDSDGVDWCFVS